MGGSLPNRIFMAEKRREHFGFAQPLFGMLAVSTAIVVLARPWWIAVICFAVFAAVAGLSERWVRRRVDRRIVQWAHFRGLREVERQRRTGLVDWGWTIFSTAETYHYRAIDAEGREHQITASYQCMLLGLRLRTIAETDGGRAADSGMLDGSAEQTL
jgi:hypothetical protein